MNRFVAVLDACVLYPAPLRDLLVRLAVRDVFAARWTDRIHDEWVRNVLADRPDLTAERLARTRSKMDLHARDALVTGYEGLIPGLILPDPDDRHVLAAAIRCGAQAIVTFNLKDFPAAALAGFGVEAVHPDPFVVAQFDLAPALVIDVVRTHRADLIRPPKTVAEYLATLEQQGLPDSAAVLRAHADQI